MEEPASTHPATEFVVRSFVGWGAVNSWREDEMHWMHKRFVEIWTNSDGISDFLQLGASGMEAVCRLPRPNGRELSRQATPARLPRNGRPMRLPPPALSDCRLVLTPLSAWLTTTCPCAPPAKPCSPTGGQGRRRRTERGTGHRRPARCPRPLKHCRSIRTAWRQPRITLATRGTHRRTSWRIPPPAPSVRPAELAGTSFFATASRPADRKPVCPPTATARSLSMVCCWKAATAVRAVSP